MVICGLPIPSLWKAEESLPEGPAVHGGGACYDWLQDKNVYISLINRDGGMVSGIGMDALQREEADVCLFVNRESQAQTSAPS